MCRCEQRTDAVGWSIAPVVSLIGSAARVVLPVVTPIAVGLGAQWISGKLMPTPKPGDSAAVPGALNDPVNSARSDAHEANMSTTVGILALAGLAIYLITKRK